MDAKLLSVEMSKIKISMHKFFSQCIFTRKGARRLCAKRFVSLFYFYYLKMIHHNLEQYKKKIQLNDEKTIILISFTFLTALQLTTARKNCHSEWRGQITKAFLMAFNQLK
ncbi:hypothetical protein Tsp_09382 [Trichinella spiralis]|uniref:hypothetical protein n=1 Tax=Trichinella spiralis TaxID=6334 RepID=UPI0001EFD14D|nr:hypothetical protein Tsp_09382 [Trichinella spiralis]